MATLHGGEVDGQEAMVPIILLNEILKYANYPIVDIDHIGTEWLSKVAKNQIIPSVDYLFLERLNKELKKRKNKLILISINKNKICASRDFR